MQRFICNFIFCLIYILLSMKIGFAANLHVTPVGLSIVAPASAGVVTVRNDGTAPITVQMRVFKWDQVNGDDDFLPTQKVAVSPPMIKLAPGAQQIVRVVRTAKGLTGQEAYRLIVDEVPSSSLVNQSGIRFLVRQSLPIFFSAEILSRDNIKWSLSSRGAGLILSAHNNGTDRLKLSSMQLKDKSGKIVAKIDGLAGYVLGGRTKKWDFAIPKGIAMKGGNLTLSADSDKGAIRASLSTNFRG